LFFVTLAAIGNLLRQRGMVALGGIMELVAAFMLVSMLAWGFLPLRWLRMPMVLLNVAMIVSAIVIGGHYLVDVIAGIAVAGAGIAAAGRLPAFRRHVEVRTA
jgi:membrane-associated phospholipid phosphatase